MADFTPAALGNNPLLVPSALPFGAPPFDRIRDEHYQPAIEEAMRLHRAEIEAIAARADAPTFENTLVALERAGQALTGALRTFHGVTSAHTNDFLQDVLSAVAPQLAAHTDAIYLDDRLFRRIDALYESIDRPELSGEDRSLLERYHLDFVRAGARLNAADKATLSALNLEESMLTTDFQNRLLVATKANALVIDDVAELEGLSAGDIAAAATTASERGLAGKWVLPLHNTTQQPLQESLKRRDVRARLFQRSLERTERGDASDTRAIAERLGQLRAERAALLGFANAAAYVLDDQMAKTPAAAVDLLTKIAGHATVKVKAEAARIQSLIDREGAGFTLEPWDWAYYAERVRKAEYDIDESEIKPYFPLERVLRDGVFFSAERLYGLTFAERHDLPVYHPDVRVFDIFDDGAPLGLLYVDFFKRDEKTGGAWMDVFVDQSDLLGDRPVIVNVTNFTKPTAGQAALLSFDEVTTLFHEFGHALHGMLSRVTYPMLSGTNVPRDFVELPSQFNEHWALEPAVFRNYARHHETGEPMPDALFERIKKSRTFNQGFALTEYIAAALIDIAWHTLAPGAPRQAVDTFEARTLQEQGVAMRAVPPRYRTSYFAHIWAGGYGAGYYAYLWAEVLDHDAWEWFVENGGMTRENGRRFRDMILSRGGTEDPAALYRAFRGREPSVGRLLVERGLASIAADPAA